jgi:hypothetical protein
MENPDLDGDEDWLAVCRFVLSEQDPQKCREKVDEYLRLEAVERKLDGKNY